jgi:ribosome-binding protein aMBF1 (putative translation factor)
VVQGSAGRSDATPAGNLLGTPGAYGSSDEPPDMGYNLWMTSRKEQRMTTKFDDFVREVEDSSTDEERRELDTARVRFKIGARLLQQRQAAGLSQQQLAAASGIAQADISRIERGQINPTAATLESLGTPLGVTLDYIPAPEFIHA